MKDNRPFWHNLLRASLVTVVLVGIMLWFKRAGKRKESNSIRIGKQEEAPGESNNAGSVWRFFYWLFFMVIFTVILIGAVFYLFASYPIPISDNLTSTGNFQATISDNQSITGTFQIQNPDNQPKTGNIETGFDLAIVSGLLGGFALTLVATRRGPKHLQTSLIVQGVFYVLATVAFIVFGFYLAADKARLLESLSGLVPVYGYCQGDCVKFPSIKLRREGRL